MPEHIFLTEFQLKLLAWLVTKNQVSDSATEIVWENVAKQFFSEDVVISHNAQLLRKCWEAISNRKNAAAAMVSMKEEPVDEVDDQVVEDEPEMHVEVGLAVDALMAMHHSSQGKGATTIPSTCILQLQMEAASAVSTQVVPETTVASEACAEERADAVNPKASGPSASWGSEESLVPQPPPPPECSAGSCPGNSVNIDAQNGMASEEAQQQDQEDNTEEDEREDDEAEDGQHRGGTSINTESEHTLELMYQIYFYHQRLRHNDDLHHQRMQHREQLHQLRMERRRSRHLARASLKTCS